MIAEKSVLREMKDIQLAMELISLGARLQILENETSLSRGRLLKLYKELRGTPPPKGMLPFSADWFMIWEHNIHSSIFYNIYLYFKKLEDSSTIRTIVKAYRLYLEICAPYEGDEPLLSLTRAWTLLRFTKCSVLQHTNCSHCGGQFITYAFQPENFTCSMCQPPSRAVKNNKLFGKAADSSVSFARVCSA